MCSLFGFTATVSIQKAKLTCSQIVQRKYQMLKAFAKKSWNIQRLYSTSLVVGIVICTWLSLNLLRKKKTVYWNDYSRMFPLSIWYILTFTTNNYQELCVMYVNGTWCLF